MYQLLQVSVNDLFKKKEKIYENKKHIKEALTWLKRAQDVSNTGGVSAWYSLVSRWAPPYIETTGYIIDTFLECADYFGNKSLVRRAVKMADFIVDMQLEAGGYRTHPPSQKKESYPTVFNTGQDLLGLTSIYKKTHNQKYLDSCIKAANFLCKIQEKDGSWVKYTYGNKTHVYHTRVAWGLLKVYQLTNNLKYKKAALKNLKWAKKFQLRNGWFQNAELPPPNPSAPYTHTISYTIEGFLFSGLILNDEKWIETAIKSADQLLEYFNRHEALPGTFDRKWQSLDNFSCLTGDAQISVVWLVLYKFTKNEKYKTAAIKMNNFLKSTQKINTDNKEIKGAIKGSLPVYGDLLRKTGYSRMAYLNWATKFFIDALILEEKLKK